MHRERQIVFRELKQPINILDKRMGCSILMKLVGMLTTVGLQKVGPSKNRDFKFISSLNLLFLKIQLFSNVCFKEIVAVKNGQNRFKIEEFLKSPLLLNENY